MRKLFALLLLAACFRRPVAARPDAGIVAPLAAREHEPNDTQAQASDLPLGFPLQGALTPGDRDWFRVAAVDGGLRVDLDSDGGALALSVSDSSGVLATYRGDGGVHLRALSGASFFELSGAPSGYTLRVFLEAGPADLEREPNDDPAHANAIADSASGFSAPPGDEDWYRVHADEASVLRASLSAGEVAVFAPDGGRLASATPASSSGAAGPGGAAPGPAASGVSASGSAAAGAIVAGLGVPEGDTLLRVRGAPLDTLYNLSVELWPDDGSTEREPNDKPDTAQTLTLPISVVGYLWPRRDVDLFRFHLDAPGSFDVTVQPPAGVALLLRFFEIHGDALEVIGSSAANPPALLSVPLRPGDYAVELSSPSGAASATEDYELDVAPTADAGTGDETP